MSLFWIFYSPNWLFSSITSLAWNQEYFYFFEDKTKKIHKVKITEQSPKTLVVKSELSKEFDGVYDIMLIDEYIYLWGIKFDLDDEEEEREGEEQQESKFPLRILRADDLTEVDFKELSDGQDPPKRDFANDPWNKPYLEKIDYEEHLEDATKQSLREYRIMLEKSCFTDGKYIYAICYYVEDITEFQNDATRIEIEIYCPKTLAFIRSCTFTPEADIDDNLTQTEKDKISEDNYELQEAIESIQETLKFAAFTGNLQHESPNSNESDEIEAQTSSLLQCSKNSAVNTVALCINQVVYFFDLDTGKR